jgi:hypothetical protein
MNHKRTIIVLAAIMMAVVPLSILAADGSDAVVDFDGVRGEGFTNRNDGTLYVNLKNSDYTDQIITAIIVKEDGREIYRSNIPVTVPANGTVTAELHFRLGSVGVHTLIVTCEPANLFPVPSGGIPLNFYQVDVTVTESIWSKPSTYGAIIVVALLIVIAAYMRIRNAPAGKPETTFTELEKQRSESREEAEVTPRLSATERKRYRGSGEPSKEAKKSSEPPAEKKKPFAKSSEPPAEKKKLFARSSAPQDEKKATSFTELERQKTEKKEPEAKKEYQPQVEEEPQPQAKKEPQPQVEEEPQPQAKKEPQPQAKKGSQPQAKKEPQPQAKKGSQPQAKKEPQPQAKKETGAKKGSSSEEPKKLKYVSPRRK